MSVRLLFVLLLLVPFAFWQSGVDALKCFDSSDHQNAGPFGWTTDGCFVCLILGTKAKTKEQQDVLVTGCEQLDERPEPLAPKKVCFDYSDDIRVCYCNTDLCNTQKFFDSASTAVTVSSVLLLVSLLAHLLAF
ncbi:hypothetical protein M3Y99_00712100 [Aphelenchoides fujianensis]|nr:hypothetical protein M3Y99_00712100 [Aphelenchoides fujianensis]